jgi:hypothetical protein
MKFSLTFLMFLICLKIGICQEINSFIKLSNSYNNLYPKEKIHIHTDKSSYSTGETIWFKAYVSIGAENSLSALSKILHVDLIDIHDKLIVQKNVVLVNGLGVADIKLQDSLPEGIYRLRAYTRWMRNFEDQYFYDRQVLIGNVRNDAIFSETSIDKNQIRVNLKSREGFPLRERNIISELIRNGKVIEKIQTVSNSYGVAIFDFKKEIESNDIITYRIHHSNTRDVIKNIYVNEFNKNSSVKIFPEGGSLINGIETDIAVRVLNDNGLGKKAKLVLMNGQDTLLSTITNELGYGKIRWTPFISDELFCVAEFEDGVITKVQMPSILNSGLGIKINQHDNVALKASLRKTLDFEIDKGLFFVVHHQGKIYFNKEIEAFTDEIELEMNTKILPSGLLSLTIFDKNFNPIAERSFFNISSNLLNPIRIYTDKSIYKTREKVGVTIQLKGDSLQPRIGAFSASVLNLNRIDVLNHYQSPNIFTSFLLQSGLNGFIESPNYYFTNDTLRLYDLDLIALSHKARNLQWTAIDTNRVLKYEVAQGIEINGNLKNIGKNTAEKGAKVKLFLKNNRQKYSERTSDDNGDFNYSNLFYPEGTEFHIKAESINRRARIDIKIYNEDNLAPINKSRNSPLITNDVNKLLHKELLLVKEHFNALEKVGRMEKIHHIDEVVVSGVRNNASPRSKNLNGPGNADYVLNAKYLEDFNTIEEAVLPFLRIYNSFEWPTGISIFLDGRYLDHETGRNLPIEAMESVEILSHKAYSSIYYGAVPKEEVGTVIVLTTKIGHDGYNSNQKEYGQINYIPKGIHINSSFFKPIYSEDTDRSKFNDLRSTIHWEPSIVVGKSGFAQFDFFTADKPGIYELTLEGLELNGSLVNKKIYINVVDN